jgi:hypothetical protein
MDVYARSLEEKWLALIGIDLKTFAARMIANPRGLIEDIARTRYAHLGPDGPEFVAQALGFKSVADVDRCKAEFDQAEKDRDDHDA